MRVEDLLLLSSDVMKYLIIEDSLLEAYGLNGKRPKCQNNIRMLERIQPFLTYPHEPWSLALEEPLLFLELGHKLGVEADHGIITHV